MVRRLLIVALCGVSTAATAMPVSFRVVAAKVVADGQFRPDPNQHQTPDDCARFRLSDKAALRYFVKAREVDEHKWREELDWTQCSARGTLKTGDGKIYRWSLDQSGRGLIMVSEHVPVFLEGPELPLGAGLKR